MELTTKNYAIIKPTPAQARLENSTLTRMFEGEDENAITYQGGLQFEEQGTFLEPLGEEARRNREHFLEGNWAINYQDLLARRRLYEETYTTNFYVGRLHNILGTMRVWREVPELAKHEQTHPFPHTAEFAIEPIVFYCSSRKFHMLQRTLSKEDWRKEIKVRMDHMITNWHEYVIVVPSLFTPAFKDKLLHLQVEFQRITRNWFEDSFNLPAQQAQHAIEAERIAWEKWEVRMGIAKKCKLRRLWQHINLWEMWHEPRRTPTNIYQFFQDVEFFHANAHRMDRIEAQMKPQWIFCLYSRAGRFLAAEGRVPVSGGRDTEIGPDVGYNRAVEY